MKTKFSRILVAVLILTLTLSIFAACNTSEESLDGMFIVTFNFNGGVLDNSATNVSGKIQHAYKPNSLVIDISSYRNYKLTKSGYVFVGWYTDEDLTHEWNFKTDRVTEDMDLYAKWESEIVYSYTLYYVDEKGNAVAFGTYRVEEGETFSDEVYHYTTGALSTTYNRTYLNDGFYKNKELTEEWDDSYTHPGGEQSLDIAVYVNSIPGKWKLVSSYEELKDAGNSNIWLMKNIDCGGEVLSLGSRGEFSATLEGNNYTISNFTIANINSNTRNCQFAIFKTLGQGACIQNVSFTDVHFAIAVATDTSSVSVAALAITATDGCVVKGVSITGTFTVDSSKCNNQNVLNALGSINNIQNAFATVNSTIDLETFSANITADLQNKQD